VDRALPALRWALTLAILGWCGWQLAGAWSELAGLRVELAPGPAIAAVASGGAALVALAVVSAAGARAARLGSGDSRFWLGWMRVWFQGYFYRYFPGKVALLVERARLARSLGVPHAGSVVLVVWETLLLLAGAGVLAGGALLVLPVGPVSGVAAGAVSGVALVGSLALGPVLRWVGRTWPALGARLPGLALEVPALAQVALVAGNAVAWALLGASFACVARALPAAEAPVGLLVTWFVASYVGGQLAGAVPAGLGVREGLLVAGLAPYAPAHAVLAWAVGHRVVLTVAELILLGLAVWIPLPSADPE
jgi:hypothetical protein